LKEHGLSTRSQDLEPVYIVNGSFYLVTAKDLRKYKSFFIEESIPLVINSKIESLDIDTEQDWEFAEYCLNKLE
jgi:N-acylneuraminate cytidylyltransferase